MRRSIISRSQYILRSHLEVTREKMVLPSDSCHVNRKNLLRRLAWLLGFGCLFALVAVIDLRHSPVFTSSYCELLMKVIISLCLLLCVAVSLGKVYFEEDFSNEGTSSFAFLTPPSPPFFLQHASLVALLKAVLAMS